MNFRLTLPQRKAATKSEKTPRKAKKDPNAPKRALSAYMFFSQDWRERVKAENPDASFGEPIPPSCSKYMLMFYRRARQDPWCQVEGDGR